MLIDPMCLDTDFRDRVKLANRIDALLRSNTLASWAIVLAGAPHAFTTYYTVLADHSIAFVSAKASRHAQACKDRTIPISGAIFDSHQVHGEAQLAGLQLFGVVEWVRERDRAVAALRAYVSSYPFYREWAHVVDVLGDDDELEYAVFLVTLRGVKILDEAVFGEETWVEARLKW